MEGKVPCRRGGRVSAFCRIVAGVALSIVVVGNVNAGAVVGATEPTQILNNIQLIQSYMQQVQTVRNTLESVRMLKQQLKGMDPRTLAELSGSSLDDVQKLAQIDGQLSQVMGSSQSALEVLQRAQASVQEGGMTPDEYLQRRAVLAQRQGSVYQKAFDADQQKLKDAQAQQVQLQRTAASAQNVTSNIQGFQHMLASGTRVESQLITLNKNIVAADARAAHQGEIENLKQQAEVTNAQKRRADFKKLEDTNVTLPDPTKYGPAGSDSGPR